MQKKSFHDYFSMPHYNLMIAACYETFCRPPELKKNHLCFLAQPV